MFGTTHKFSMKPGLVAVCPIPKLKWCQSKYLKTGFQSDNFAGIRRVQTMMLFDAASIH